MSATVMLFLCNSLSAFFTSSLVSFEGATIIPMYNNYVMALANTVATPEKISNNWNLDGFRCVERWWFA